MIQVKNEKAGRNAHRLWEDMKKTDLAAELTAAGVPIIYGIMHLGRTRPADGAKLLCAERREGGGEERDRDRLGKSCFVSYIDDDIACVPPDMRTLLSSFVTCSHIRRLMTASRQELLGGDKKSAVEVVIDDYIESCFRPLVLGTNLG